MKKYCLVCKKELIKGKKSKRQWEKQRFCSKNCFGKTLKKVEIIKCEGCKKIVERKKRSDSKSRFCSTKCAVINASKIALLTRDYRGEKNPAWKNGKTKSSTGHIFLSINGKKILEHRAIVEKHIGRFLKNTEVVHHINGIKDDNRIENLVVMSKGDHTKEHIKNGDIRLDYWKNKKMPEEHKRNISIGLKASYAKKMGRRS